MLEAMVSSGGGKGQTYPDSGPGPKTLKNGNENIGYFGEVSSTELFTLAELRRQTDFWVGANNAPTPSWIKMFLDSKVIYFPTQALASGISWNSLYGKGLIYGVDNDGYAPGSPAVNQLVYVTKETFNFKIRVFKTHDTEPANQGGQEAIGTSTILKSGEWGRVIMPLLSPRPNGYTGDSWGLYTSSLFILPPSSLAIGQNTRQADPTQCIGIGNVNTGLIPKSSAGYLWMPVLELAVVTDPVYFAIKEPQGVGIENIAPVVMGDVSYTDGLERYRSVSGGPQTANREVNVGEVSYEDPLYGVNTTLIKVATNESLPAIVTSVTYE